MIDFLEDYESGLPVEVSIWQLAPDEISYGEKAGWFILVTPDGDTEMAGTWPTAEEARNHAIKRGWSIVPMKED